MELHVLSGPEAEAPPERSAFDPIRVVPLSVPVAIGPNLHRFTTIEVNADSAATWVMATFAADGLGLVKHFLAMAAKPEGKDLDPRSRPLFLALAHDALTTLAREMKRTLRAVEDVAIGIAIDHFTMARISCTNESCGILENPTGSMAYPPVSGPEREALYRDFRAAVAAAASAAYRLSRLQSLDQALAAARDVPRSLKLVNPNRPMPSGAALAQIEFERAFAAALQRFPIVAPAFPALYDVIVKAAHDDRMAAEDRFSTEKLQRELERAPPYESDLDKALRKAIAEWSIHIRASGAALAAELKKGSKQAWDVGIASTPVNEDPTPWLATHSRIWRFPLIVRHALAAMNASPASIPFVAGMATTVAATAKAKREDDEEDDDQFLLHIASMMIGALSPVPVVGPVAGVTAASLSALALAQRATRRERLAMEAAAFGPSAAAHQLAHPDGAGAVALLVEGAGIALSALSVLGPAMGRVMALSELKAFATGGTLDLLDLMVNGYASQLATDLGSAGR